MTKKILLLLFTSFLLLSCAEKTINKNISAVPGNTAVSEPSLFCDSAILADYKTGKILYEKGSNIVTPPASMTKLVVNYIVFKEIEEGNVSLDDYVPVDSEADFRNQPPRSSLMFIEEGQKVTLRECLLGLAIPSGNDAAVAVAKYICGDVDSFIERMNYEMKQLGLEKTHFADTSGYSEHNQTTASEFLKFIRKYVDFFPGSIEEFHSLKLFAYPEIENYGKNNGSVHGKIVQYNHNLLVGRVDGVEGLKTGYIDESGFNVSLSAERDGMHLIGVIMGSRAETPKECRIRGSFDAAVLLTYGFSSFRTVTIRPELKEQIRLWKGNNKYLEIDFPENVVVTVPLNRLENLSYDFEIREPVRAPLKKDGSVGVLNIYSGHEIYKTFPLKIKEDISKSGLFKSMLDEVAIYIRYRLLASAGS